MTMPNGPEFEERQRDAEAREKAKPVEPEAFAEVGTALNMPFGTMFYDSWELMRLEDVSLAQLNTMRKTNGQARALYRLITLPIRAALKTATFLPEDNIDGGEDEAKFIEQMFTLPSKAGGMDTPFRKVIAQMLTGIFDGFSAFEQVYHSPKVGPLKGKWTLQKLAYRPSETITFLLDKHGNFNGLRQYAQMMNRTVDVKIDPENCCYFTCQAEEREFYGQSMFQAAFYHYDKIVKLEYIAHLAAQRASLGTRIGTVPQGASQSAVAAFNRALSDLGFAQSMSVPAGYEVEIMREGPPFLFIDYLNYHNSQMSKSVLASFYDEHQGGSDTSFVDFGKQTDNYFLIMLDTIMDDIADVINTQIIPKFIDWNFKSNKYPKFQFGQLTDSEKEALRTTFEKLATAGQTLTCTPQFVFEIEKQLAGEFGLEIDYEEVEKEQIALRAQQQKLLDATITATAAKGAVVPGQPTEPAGKPGPNPDSVRTSKPANPAAKKPTGKIGLTAEEIETSEAALYLQAAQWLDEIRTEAQEQTEDE